MGYHDKTLALLGREPPQANLPAELPRSIAEWYALGDGVSLLREYSNQDHPLAPSDFDIVTENDRVYTVFMRENQGVCWWAYTTERDDPPVYVNLDPPPNQWSFHAESFSTFVYTRVFDFRHWCDTRLSISGSGDPVSPETLERLRDGFEEHPTTKGWPGNTQYRFSREDQRIIIWDAAQQADWHFTADSPESVVSLYSEFSDQLSWHTDHPIGNEAQG